MTLEQPIQPAMPHMHHIDVMRSEVDRLDTLAAQLMAVQRNWNDSTRDHQLTHALEASRHAWHAIQTALAESALPLPPDVQHNLLILSVYAHSKIDACEDSPSADVLSRLIALTHTLAGSLKEWRVAA